MNLKIFLNAGLMCSILLNVTVSIATEPAANTTVKTAVTASTATKAVNSEAIEARLLERLFQSTYFAHTLVSMVDKKIKSTTLSAAQAAETKREMYWGVIDEYRAWLQERNVKKSAIEQLQAAYLSPEGVVFTRIMDPKYPFEPFQKAIIMTPVELTAEAPAPADVRAIFDIIYFRKVADTIINLTLKAYHRPAAPTDIEKSYDNLIRATAATLFKEGLNKTEFTVLLKKFRQPEVKNIFTVLNDFTPERLETALESRLPAAK